MSDENHDGSSSSSPSPSLKKSENEEESQFEEASTDGFSLDNDNDNDHDNDHDNADNNLFPDDPIDLKVVTPPTNTVVVVDWKDGFQSLHLRDSDHRTLEEEVGGVVHNHNSSHTQVDSFHHHDVPFYGRQDELQTLQKALKRISLEWMENPPEVCWITGECGVGKTALIRQLILVEKKSTSISTSSLLFCQGTCEQHHCATQPFRALTDCLNDLCSQLLLFPRNNNNNNNNGNVWKSRLEDALGGEGPLLGTIVPQLAKLLNVAPMSPKFLMPFDANTPKRLDRLAFAVRDLLQAVSEYHPVVMIVDNIHWADSDSLKMMEELLSTTKPPLPNFLLIGLHEPLPLLQHEVVPEEEQEEDQQQQHSHDDDDALELLKHRIGQQTETRVTTMDLERMDLQSVEEILCGVFLEEQDLEDDAAIDKVQDLGEILFALTKGNTLWMMSLLRLLYDIKLVYFTTKTDDDHKWDWNRKKIKKTLKGWRESNDKAFGSCQGVLATRLDKLPKKVKFVVTAMSSLGLSTFCVAKLYPCLQVAFRTGKEGKECPITSQEDLELFCFKACEQGIFKRLAKPGYYKFVHGIVRDAAYTLLKKPSVVHFKLGTELQALSIAHQGEERERFKFLAVYQLNQCVKTQEDPNVKAKVAKLNLEAAELAIQKTAFRTSIEYLETGINALDPEIQWKPPFYEATLRTFLVLARMRLCCGRLDQARDACEDIFLNATSLKDRVHASQVIGMLLLEQKQYSTALEKIAHILAEMGEVFPKEDLGKIVDREIHGLRKMVRQKDNKQLLNPPRMSDKKMIDAMALFAQLVEISRFCKPRFYLQLVTIRMMHLSLKFGFTRQYPLAFSLYSVILVKKGLVKEAMRMGQVAEKIARLDDFYGGEAVAMFHWHVGHWRRTYKRSLEPVLKIYNAQIDAGDFHHVDFSISVYSQYHLASGYDLERLSDNLQLFDSVYQDYSLPTYWHIVLPQQVVSNLLGQTANPLMFFGDAIEQEETQIKAWEDAGEKDALEYFYFLRLFVAFFFHDVDVAVTCLERITKAPEGVWIPWLVFLECYYMIQRLPATKGKVKKELKERIDEEKGKLIDWYNGGAPNPNAMVSLLEAELVIALKSGKQLSAMKVQEYYNEAVDAAHDDGAAHLEAFALERVGLHFHATGVDGLSAEYLEKAHTAYDRWGCVAKVIDIETEFAAKLEITTRRQRPCAAFIERNKGLKPDQNRQIGGGHGEIKAPNLKKAGKNIGKRFKKGGKTVKGLFSKKEQADVQEDDVQLSPNKPRSSLAVEEADSNVSDEETNDVEASPKRTSYFSPQSKKKKIGISFRKGKPKKEKMPLLEGD